MILEVSYRTDIIAFYYKWFLNRINSGFLYKYNVKIARKITPFKVVYEYIDSPFFIDKNIININEKNIIHMKQESIIKENNQLKLF